MGSPIPFKNSIAAAAARSPLPSMYKRRTITASVTLTAKETGTVVDNLGAAGTIAATLPQNAPKGTWFLFIVKVAQVLNVDPGAAGAFYVQGAKQTDNKHIGANAIGEALLVVADGAGDWDALDLKGTWEVES